MSICKDCIYIDICDYTSGTTETACGHFKDSSKFIELPCKVGDVIFCTTMGKIYKGIVGRIELDDEGFAIITTDGYCFDSSICYHTQEEAEQALAKRNQPDNTPQ